MFSFMNKNQKIAVIGSGYWGTIIIKTLIELKFNNITIFDKSTKNKKIAKKKFKSIKFQNNFTNILNDKDMLNVFVVTPPSENFLIVKKLILNNKNIFLEKPGFKNVKDIKKIKNYLKKSRSKLMFGYIYCYNDYIKYIKKILDQKLLGNILYINLQRQNLGPIRNDVSVADDLSSHDLSIILFLFNKLPSVLKHIKYSILKKNISDISNLHMKLNKTYIDINNSWLSPIKVRTLSIVGSKKMLLFNEMNINEPIKIYDKYAKYPRMEEFNKKFFKAKALIHLGKNISPKIKSSPALVNEVKHFLNSDLGKNKPTTDFKFSFKILKLLKRI